jgi:hypothetical protein
LIDEGNVMTSLFIVALSLAAAPAVPPGCTVAGPPDHVVVAQLGSGDITSPIGQTSANTTSGGMGGLDRTDTLGGSTSGAASTPGATTAGGSTSTPGSTTTSPSPSPSSSGGLGTTGNTGNTGSTGGTSGTGLGGTSTSTGLGSTTGGMR